MKDREPSITEIKEGAAWRIVIEDRSKDISTKLPFLQKRKEWAIRRINKSLDRKERRQARMAEKNEMVKEIVNIGHRSY